MRPFIGPQQHHQQPQKYGAHDNCLKQQQQQQHQHFLKSQHQQQQQQQQQFQQNYHQHQQQQHSLQQQQQLHNHNNALPQPTSTVPPPHMWNHGHLNPNCYGLAPNHNYATTTTSGNSIPPNLQGCRPFPTTRAYQQLHHPTHNVVSHYSTTTTTSNGYAASQNSERIALTASPNYAKLPPLSVVNQQRINECAGIPLISTATAHLTPGQRQRISRKQSHSPPGKNWPNMLSTNTAASSYAQYAAAHVQGAPLMLQKPLQQQQHMPPQAYATKPNGQYNNKQLDRTRTPLRYQNSAPAALTSTKSKENLDLQLKQQHSNKDSENSSSTNGDGNTNETCLPRIIKPRKRRKKDRKPVNNLVTSVYLKMDMNSTQKSSEDILKGLQKLSNAKAGCQELMQHSSKVTKMGGVNMNVASFYGKEPNSFNVSQCMNSLTKEASGDHGGICFCNECDPLRSLWDYPLRRSLSDSSATSESSGTGSLSDSTTATNECNWPKSRAEIVGVIGSKRNKDAKNNSNNSSNATNNTNENTLFNHNILSGINLSGELFKPNNSSNFITSPPVENMLLLPETAETLLTRSINEISKKLIETCSSNETYDFPLSSCNSLSSFSTTSSSSSSTSSANSICADFANDSGIESAHINVGDDLVFNFDNLHITTATITRTGTAKAILSPSSSSTSESSSSSSCSSASTSSSSCGNISMSSSPTVKFATNFLTTPTTATSSMGVTAGTAAANSSSSAALTPSTAMGLTQQPTPTLDLLVDLNNNHLHVAPTSTPTLTSATTTTTTTAQTMLNHVESNRNKKQQKQEFNDLLPQNHQPPQQNQQRQQLTSTLQQQHEQQFFNNCFDLLWQQHEHERQLTNNNTNTNSTSSSTTTATTTNPYHHQHIDQLSSSAGLISNNVAMSSFLDSVGSLKTVFSTIY